MRPQRTYWAPVLALICVLVIFVAPVQAKTQRTVVHGTETCVQTDPGTIWTDETTIHIRDSVRTCTDVADKPMGTGTNHVTLSANWDKITGFGPMWGTAHFVTTEGGVWDLHVEREGYKYRCPGPRDGPRVWQVRWAPREDGPGQWPHNDVDPGPRG